MVNKEILLAGDAAELLGCSASLVKQRADRGDLPLLGRSPRGVRVFDRAAIERLAREGVSRHAA
ncbi:MAG TPA: hypothetical protein VMV27_07335 [Candidatus Binataceae bacterium]|nr:hypothetical protein [Candidatus Binataceae bacterium]